jgi:hypothetical protein
MIVARVDVAAKSFSESAPLSGDQARFGRGEAARASRARSAQLGGTHTTDGAPFRVTVTRSLHVR